METEWCKKFQKEVLTIDWKNIYTRKVKHVQCMKLAEFNYKLLHNLVVTGYILSKWNKLISDKCIFCNLCDTVEHLLFDCNRIKAIWTKVGECLKIDINWSHIIIGLHGLHIQFINHG